MAGWLDLLRSLSVTFVEVLRAEKDALCEDLTSSGRRLGAALAMLAMAAFLLFWAFGAAAFLLFQVLAVWVPGWAASLVVLGVLLIVGVVLARLARRRLRSLESPAATVRRRIEDHRRWWSERLLAEGGSADQPAAPSETRRSGR